MLTVVRQQIDGVRRAGAGFIGLVVAVGFMAVNPQGAHAQTRPTTRPPVAQQPGMAAKEIDSAALAKADARNAALALCRDLKLYSETSRSTGGLGESAALFSAMKPLCAEAENPSPRKEIGTCTGSGSSITTPCATHWWEPLWDGLSWCDDLKRFCIGVGGTWSSHS